MTIYLVVKIVVDTCRVAMSDGVSYLFLIKIQQDNEQVKIMYSAPFKSAKYALNINPYDGKRRGRIPIKKTQVCSWSMRTLPEPQFFRLL